MTSPAAKKRQGLLIAAAVPRDGAGLLLKSLETVLKRKKRQIKSSSRAARAASAEKFRKSV